MSETSATRSWDGAVVASALGLTAIGVLMNYSTTAALEIGRDAAAARAAPRVGRRVRARLRGARRARAAARSGSASRSGCGRARVALLVATALFGVEANGARRWLVIPGVPFAIQAAEPAKLTTALAVAALLANATPKSLASWALLQRVALLVALPVLLLLLQPDFGGARDAVRGGRLRAVRRGPAAARARAAGASRARSAPRSTSRCVPTRPRACAASSTRGRARRARASSSCSRSSRSAAAAAFGVGLGNGLQKLFYLPEAHTDFILSVVAEELGLLGVLLVLGAFAALCWAGLRIASRARTPFALLAASACTALIVVPAICNAAVVMGLVPTKGLTLPFLSHGSNSLLCSALAIGILLRAGREPAGTPQARARRGVGAPSSRGA